MTKLKDIFDNLGDLQREFPIQTFEEERAMIAMYSSNRPKLNELLVLHNIGFAREFTKQLNYSSRTEDREDIVMLALEGMTRAAESFDTAKNVRFCTYAGYLIQRTMRDVFGDITNNQTIASLDAPIGNEEGEESTQKSLILTKNSPFNNVSTLESLDLGIDPAQKLIEGEDAEYIIDKVVGLISSTTIREVCRQRIKGSTLMKIADSMGLSKERVRQMEAKGLTRIKKAIEQSNEDDPNLDWLREVFPIKVQKRIFKDESPIVQHERLRAFLSGANLKIEKFGETETVEDRVDRVMDEFDAAASEFKKATGRDYETIYFTALRNIYEGCIGRGLPIDDVCAKIGVPMSYGRLLRDRAVRLLRQYKTGMITTLYRGSKDSKEADIFDSPQKHVDKGELHDLKDEIFNVTAPSEGMKTFEYGSYLSPWSGYQRKNKRKCTVFYPFYGGFYSEHSRLVHARRNVMSKREVKMMMRGGYISNP